MPIFYRRKGGYEKNGGIIYDTAVLFSYSTYTKNPKPFPIKTRLGLLLSDAVDGT